MSFKRSQTWCPSRLQLLTCVLAVGAISACGEGPVSPAGESPDVSIHSAVFAKAADVTVCHRTGNNAYELLAINANAFPAHQAHGDGAPGSAVPDGSGATFDADCVPQSEDVTGSYILQTVGGEALPALGTGELLHAGTIVLNESGSCSFTMTSQGAQEDPEGEIETFTFQSCAYSLDGTELTLSVVDEEEGGFNLDGQLIDGQIILPILIWDDADETDEGVMGDAVFVKA